MRSHSRNFAFTASAYLAGDMLMQATAHRLIEVGEQCLAMPLLADVLKIVHPPTVGLVMMQVREPVRRERFYLGEVVVTRCEVLVGEIRGWAMVSGENKEAALAAALCDAVTRTTESEFAEARTAVEELCRETRERLEGQVRREWTELAPTRVDFEEFE